MNRQELIDAVASASGESKAAVDRVLTEYFKTVMNACAKGDSVQIIGFGTFTRAFRDAKEGRNPHTGEKMNIAAKYVPKFSAGKVFRTTVEEAK